MGQLCEGSVVVDRTAKFADTGFAGIDAQGFADGLDQREPVDQGEQVLEPTATAVVDRRAPQTIWKHIVDRRPRRAGRTPCERKYDRVVGPMVKPRMPSVGEIAKVGRLHGAERSFPKGRVEQRCDGPQQRIGGDDQGVAGPKARPLVHKMAAFTNVASPGQSARDLFEGRRA